METVEKRIEAQKILSSAKKSDDQKLHEIFVLYKEDLQREYPQLYYALLGWKDVHLQELTRRE